MAVITLTSVRMSVFPPIRSNSRSCRTRRRAIWVSGGSSPTSSRKIEVPASLGRVARSLAHRGPDGRYREIHVVLNGNLRAAGYYLAYRHGYFIDDHSSSSKNSTAGAPGADDVLALDSRVKYVRLAMSHGAPTPEDILFKVRVLPIGSTPEQELARNNLRNSALPLKPPCRRFAVDMAAVPDAFQLTLDKDGNRTGAIEFSVILYDNDGTVLNATVKTVQLNLNQEGYRRFLSGVNGISRSVCPSRPAQIFSGSAFTTFRRIAWASWSFLLPQWSD